MSPRNQISPSNLHRRRACPGSERMEAIAPPQESSIFAEEGTRLHGIMEAFLKQQTLPAMSDEDRPKIDFCLSVLGEIMERHQGLLTSREVETKRDLAWLGMGRRGMCDLALYQPFGRGVVIDWKFGRGGVETPAENLQLLAYAVDLAKRNDLVSVEVHIVQPSAALGLERHPWATVTDFVGAAQLIRDVVAAAEAPDAPLRTSKEGCQYCKAASICPQLKKEVMAVPPVDALEAAGPEQLAEGLDLVERIEVFAKALRQRAYAVLVSGTAIPGWTLEPTKGHAKWIEGSEDELISHAEARGIPAVDLYEDPKLLSPAKARDILRDKSIRLKKDDPGLQLIERLSFRPEGENKLVRSKGITGPGPLGELADAEVVG